MQGLRLDSAAFPEPRPREDQTCPELLAVNSLHGPPPSPPCRCSAASAARRRPAQVRCRAVRPRQPLHEPDRSRIAEDAVLQTGRHRHRHAGEGGGVEEEVRLVRQRRLQLSEHVADGVEPGHRHRLRRDAECVAHGPHAGRRGRGQTCVLREAAGGVGGARQRMLDALQEGRAAARRRLSSAVRAESPRVRAPGAGKSARRRQDHRREFRLRHRRSETVAPESRAGRRRLAHGRRHLLPADHAHDHRRRPRSGSTPPRSKPTR